MELHGERNASKRQLSDSELMKVDVEVQEVGRVMKTRLWCSSMQNLPYRIQYSTKGTVDLTDQGLYPVS